MAGAGPEILVDMNQLIPGIEYTFIYHNGDRYRGILETYVANERIPRSAVRLANGFQRNGAPQQGRTTFPLDFVNRVIQHTDVPNLPIQAQTEYRDGMRPSERFMKHGWLAERERYIPAIHNRAPNDVVDDPRNVRNIGASIEARNINGNTNPQSNYYSPEERENMQRQIKNVECPLCLAIIDE